MTWMTDWRAVPSVRDSQVRSPAGVSPFTIATSATRLWAGASVTSRDDTAAGPGNPGFPRVSDARETCAGAAARHTISRHTIEYLADWAQLCE